MLFIQKYKYILSRNLRTFKAALPTHCTANKSCTTFPDLPGALSWTCTAHCTGHTPCTQLASTFPTSAKSMTVHPLPSGNSASRDMGRFIAFHMRASLALGTPRLSASWLSDGSLPVASKICCCFFFALEARSWMCAGTLSGYAQNGA